eukprot:g1875.t1
MLVTLDDLAAAFEQGKKAAPLEQWARDIYRRIAAALQRMGWTAREDWSTPWASCEAFGAVSQHQRAQKSEFYALVNSLDLGLRSEQLEWLWKLTDTNSDGLLDYHEFAQRMVEVTGIRSTAYPVPKPEEDGLVARGELLAFTSRCRAAWSDWELDKVFARLDGERRGAIPKRAIRTGGENQQEELG